MYLLNIGYINLFNKYTWKRSNIMYIPIIINMYAPRVEQITSKQKNDTKKKKSPKIPAPFEQNKNQSIVELVSYD